MGVATGLAVKAFGGGKAGNDIIGASLGGLTGLGLTTGAFKGLLGGPKAPSMAAGTSSPYGAASSYGKTVLGA